MLLRDLADLPPVLPVEQGGAILGLGRSASYEAAKRGELPTIAIGRRRVVPTARLLTLLGLNPSTNANEGPPLTKGPSSSSLLTNRSDTNQTVSADGT
ncbi:MAG: helix-turn-helix domain-containing protein [Actinomycetota bacterium]|nr:helix-turn-helix domain-containing protein [Actinomycetota bacterium]